MKQNSTSDSDMLAPARRAAGIDAILPVDSKWYRLRQDGTVLMRYLLDSEVHTYAFSVAANAILSFIPFIVLLYTIAISYLHSQQMANVVSDMVGAFLPANTSDPNWIAESLAAVVPHHRVQFFSLVIILISCTGIFLPLEVALNQAWGVRVSRNYLLNQAVAFGLALLMVILAMVSIGLNAVQRQILTMIFFNHVDNFVFRSLSAMWLILSSGAACIVFFFAIYWILPNCKVPWRSVLRTSVVTGIIWLLSKYLFVLALPHLDLRAIYGPFFVSVGLLLWSYISGLILFAGAQFSVNRTVASKLHENEI
jgi:YihY family inner membrane protein